MLLGCGPLGTARRIAIFLGFVFDIVRRLGYVFRRFTDKLLEVVELLLH